MVVLLLRKRRLTNEASKMMHHIWTCFELDEPLSFCDGADMKSFLLMAIFSPPQIKWLVQEAKM